MSKHWKLQIVIHKNKIDLLKQQKDWICNSFRRSTICKERTQETLHQTYLNRGDQKWCSAKNKFKYMPWRYVKSTLENLTYRNARWLSVNKVRSTAKSSAVLRRIHQPPVIMSLLQSRRLLIPALMASQRLGRQATTCSNQISIDTQLPSKILVAALQVPSAPVNQENSGWSRITQVKEDILLHQIPDHHSAH